MTKKLDKNTENEIIKGCIANKRRSQEVLYRAHFAPMMRMIMRYTQDEEVAMTICNDGFLKVFRRIESYEGRGSFQGWIRRIVYHAMSDHFRKEAKYIQFMVFDDYEKESHAAALSDLYLDDLLDLVGKLPSMTSQVFRLYAIEGFNHREIGERLSMSDNTSKWHLANARKKLKSMLKKQEETYVKKNG